MRVLVCGGRDLEDYKYVERILNSYHFFYGFSCLIHGGAYGADNLAGVWAQQHEIPMEVYPADWKQHGKAAGPIRNKQMLDEGKPDIVIAFPGGKGTANMVDQAHNAGIEVYVVNDDKTRENPY